MKTIIIAAFCFLTIQAQALDNVSKQCIQEGTNAIISYLETEEPKADLHYTLDKNGDITAIIDAADIYAGFDLQEIVTDGTDEAVIYFNDQDYVVFVILKETQKDGKIQCEIVAVDSSQDDQD